MALEETVVGSESTWEIIGAESERTVGAESVGTDGGESEGPVGTEFAGTVGAESMRTVGAEILESVGMEFVEVAGVECVGAVGDVVVVVEFALFSALDGARGFAEGGCPCTEGGVAFFGLAFGSGLTSWPSIDTRSPITSWNIRFRAKRWMRPFFISSAGWSPIARRTQNLVKNNGEAI